VTSFDLVRPGELLPTGDEVHLAIAVEEDLHSPTDQSCAPTTRPPPRARLPPGGTSGEVISCSCSCPCGVSHRTRKARPMD
jgi:hypothetical protein